MTAQCPLCKSEISDDNPAFAIVEIEKWVKSEGGWEIFESDSDRYGYPEGKEFRMDLAAAKLVKKKTTYDSGEIDRSGYYDSELPQGTEFPVFVVLQYRGRFYKKSGTGDSYSKISWDGDLVPVVPTVKTIEVYEYA